MINKLKSKTSRKLLQLKLLAIFLQNSSLKSRTSVAASSVWLNLSIDYERYKYILCKFFELEGYQVYINADLKFLVKLTDKFSRLMITEGRIIFTNKKPAHPVAEFSDRSRADRNVKFISKDYFTTIFDNDLHSYHIPIGMHPKMYSTGLWNAHITPRQPKRSVFFAGSFKEVYQEMSGHEKFNMPDRLQLKNMLRSLPNATFPRSYQELMQNSEDGQIDIVSMSNFKLPQEILRQTIAGYSFFIACPGFIMPQSHNVYEALSVGTIPVIHRQYARMFHPELEDNKTAIVYEDNFIERISQALQIEPEHIQLMQTQVRNYYNEHLTPSAIVRQLINPEKTSYFLNAEKNSVLVMK
jgi:hypothetical protein